MKKNYNHPNTRIFNVKIQSLLSNSPGTAPGMGGATNNVNDLLSRDRNSDWDDEDEW